MSNPVTDDITQWQDNASSSDTNLPVKDTSIGITTVGDLTGELRRIKSEIRGESIIKSWERWKGLMNLAGTGPVTFTTATATNFFVNDNFISAARLVAVPGRRVRAFLAGATLYGRIKAAALNAPNTSIEVLWDSGALDATLSEVQFGLDRQSYFNGVLDASSQGSFGAVTGTVAETPFYIPTIYGGTIGSLRRVDAHLLMRISLIPGSYIQVLCYYGGSLPIVLTLSNPTVTNINSQFCPLTLSVWGNGSTNNQILHGEWRMAATQSGFPAQYDSNAIGTAIDSNLDQVLEMNVLLSSATGNCDCLGSVLEVRGTD